MNVKSARRLNAREVEALDPYMLMAVLGKRVIHPGGKLSTEELFRRADFAAGQRVLDVGCGVGTTAIEVAGRFGAHVTAVDVHEDMLAEARRNVQRGASATACATSAPTSPPCRSPTSRSTAS